MSHICNGIGVYAILKNNKYLRFESGLENECSANLSGYTTLFAHASNVEDIIEGIKYGFVERTGNDPKEFWKYFKELGDIEGFKRFSTDLRKIGVDQISRIVLCSDEDKLSYRVYRWLIYTPLTDQISMGGACSPVKKYYAEESALFFIRKNFPELEGEWEDDADEDIPNEFDGKFLSTWAQGVRAIKSKQPREDGFYVYDDFVYDYSKNHHDMFDFSIPAGIRGMKGITKLGDDIMFNCPGAVIEVLTITTDLKYLDPGDFFVNGINNLKVIDSKTGELLFQTKAFKEASSLLCEREKFEKFCKMLPSSSIEEIQALFKRKSSVPTKTNSVAKSHIDIVEDTRVTVPFPHASLREILKKGNRKKFIIHDDTYRGKCLHMYTGDDAIVVIPEDIKHINSGAFEGLATLKKIVFSNPIYIDEGAFADCINLEEIVIDSDVLGGKNIFAGCNSVKKVIITESGRSGIDHSLYEDLPNTAFNFHEGGYYIGSETNPYKLLVRFDDNQYAETTIPPETERICWHAFKKCNIIRKIVISEGITRIDDSTFKGCQSLKTVELPSSITNIEPRAFCDCSALETITIPRGVKKIAKEAFLNCRNLASVIISDGIEYIGDFAFANCESLRQVVVPESVKTIRSSAFEGSPNVVIVSNGGYPEKFANKNNIEHQSMSQSNIRPQPTNFVAKENESLSNAKIIHDELRLNLRKQMERAGDYLYPETEDGHINGVFTKEPDFDILKQICAYAVEKGKTSYDGPWQTEDLFKFLRDDIGDCHIGGTYSISFSFGGALPILALLPFLLTFSKIGSFKIIFTRDKWEARGDYYGSEHVGMKMIDGKIVVDIFEDGNYLDDERDPDFDPQNAANSWMGKYGNYVTLNPHINFIGHLFVFSGFDHAYEKEHPIVQQVIEHGGQYRSKVSRLTNYLVINPALAGESKINAAIEQIEKGNKITVILLEDMERALEEPIDTIGIAKELADRKAQEETKRIEKEERQRILAEARKTREEARAISRQQAEKQEQEKAERKALIEKQCEAFIDEIKKENEASGNTISYHDLISIANEKGLSESILNRYTWKNYTNSLRGFLEEQGITMARNNAHLEFDRTIALLKERYSSDNKLSEVSKLIEANSDLDLSVVSNNAKKYTGMTARELLIKEGILASESIKSMDQLTEGVLYKPGEEPADIKKRLAVLFPKLDGAYPDKVIFGLNKDHKKWGETVTDIYRKLGYKSSNDFLQAYGYTIAEGRGGRPKLDANEFIEELKRRYPNGSDCQTLAELREQNPDLASRFSNIENNSARLFGMTFVAYLKQIGVMGKHSRSHYIADDKSIEEAERKAHEDEALRKAKEVASGNSIDEAYRKAQEDAERRKREAAEREAQEVARKAEEEAKRIAEEAENRRRQEQEAKERLEAAYRKAQEDAERRQRELALRQVREEAERKKREEIECKCREAEERRIRAEEERKAKEEAERKAREEERRAREEAQRKAEEEAKRKLEQEKENAIKGRAEFTASEKEKIDQAYEKTVSELTAAFEAKRSEIQNQLESTKKLRSSKEQELDKASFFAFIRKKNLKRDIELAHYQIKKMEDELSTLLKDHSDKLHDEEIKRKNKIDALPMRAAKKFPMPK